MRTFFNSVELLGLVDSLVDQIVEVHEEDESVFKVLAVPISQHVLGDGFESLYRKHSEVIDHMFHHMKLWVDNSVHIPIEFRVGLIDFVLFLFVHEWNVYTQNLSELGCFRNVLKGARVFKSLVVVEQDSIACMGTMFGECFLDNMNLG